MMNLSKDNIAKIKESLKVGSLSDKWWKHLKKDVNKCKLSKQDKIIVYGCIIRGMVDECYALAKTQDDMIYCHELLTYVMRQADD